MLSSDGGVVTENYRASRPHLWGLVLLLEITLELLLELVGTTEPPLFTDEESKGCKEV